MTRNQFLLTLPVLAFLKPKEKFIDFRYEFQLVDDLLAKCPTKKSSIPGCDEDVLVSGPESDAVCWQDFRCSRLRIAFGTWGPRDPETGLREYLGIPDDIMSGARKVTERQFEQAYSNWICGPVSEDFQWETVEL